MAREVSEETEHFYKTMSGERGDVDCSVVDDWKKKLPVICEGYEPRDIFNMDDTGIFYKADSLYLGLNKVEVHIPKTALVLHFVLA